MKSFKCGFEPLQGKDMEINLMKITKKMVSYVAELSRLKLSDEQTIKMQADLESIIGYMDVLNRLDTSEIEPLSHIFSVKNVFREDEVTESYDRETLLRNAPVRDEECFIVPKTVE